MYSMMLTYDISNCIKSKLLTKMMNIFVEKQSKKQKRRKFELMTSTEDFNVQFFGISRLIIWWNS